MLIHTKCYFKFSINNLLVGFYTTARYDAQRVRVYIVEPLHRRGELVPNAGVLLLTKERGEDDEVMRKSS